MTSPRGFSSWVFWVPCFTAVLLGLTCFSRKSIAQTSPVDLKLRVDVPFRFVAYGDARFHNPGDTDAADPAVRVALVKAIAGLNPAFICFTGDVVYNGADGNDWQIWDSETSAWREKGISVYPTLGNHDLRGNERIALANYFDRFPYLKSSRYYSVRAGNTLVLALDSSWMSLLERRVYG